MQNRPVIDGDSGDGKNSMKNSSYLKAKVLTLIPIIVLAVIVLCMVLAAILEVPTSRGALYTILALAGLMGVFIAPLPCLVMAILGTMFAAKAGKEGVSGARLFFVMGIIEIIVCAAGAFLSILMFLAGLGV